MKHDIPHCRVAALLLAIGASTTCGLSLAAEANTQKSSDVSAEIAKARTLYREAQAAFEAENYELAQRKLLQAWEIRKTFDVASALAQADLELKQYRNAAEHAEYCLRVFSPAESDATLKSVQDMYAEAKQHVALVRLKVTPEGAVVQVDGKAVGTAPIASPVFLEPGLRSFQVQLQAASSNRALNVEAGREYDVDFAVGPATQPIGLASTSTATSPGVVSSNSPAAGQVSSPDYRPVYWTLGIGGGLTAAGVVTGLLLHGHANSKQDSISAIRARNTNCTNVGSVDCAQLPSLASARNSANEQAQVVLGVSVAVAAATGVVTYFLWPSSHSNSSYATNVWATPNGAGFGLSGQF